MKKFYLIVFMVGCFVVFQGILGAQDVNMTQVGEWGTGYYRDVSIKGNYAFCTASYQGLDIIDISSPSLPVQVGHFDDGGFFYRLHVSGNYAYITSGNELVILDVSDPVKPVKVSHYYAGEQVSDVWLKDNYAYLAVGSYLGYNGLQVVDVSSPFSPFLAGQYNTPVTYSVTGLFVKDNYAYMTTEFVLNIIDITIPTAPVLAGEVEISWMYTENVYVSGNYAYTSSYYYDSDGAYFGSLDIIDVSNPGTPVRVGSYSAEEWKGNVGELFVIGNYAYFPYGTGEIHIIDVSTPSTPSLVKKYETPGQPDGLTMEGQYVFVASGHGGLQILDAASPADPSPEGDFDHSIYIMDVKVKGNYAYAVGYREGLVIFDVSTPSSPSLVSHYELGNLPVKKIFISGPYAYVIPIKKNTLDMSTLKLYIIDISKPHTPSLAGTYGSYCEEEISIHVSGNYAYLLGSYFLDILDISDPSQVRAIGTYTFSQYSDLNSGIWVGGNYAYVTRPPVGVEILDVSNPSAPTPVGSFAAVDSPRDIYVNGNYAYVTGEELTVLDISNPPSPSLVGTFDYGNWGSVSRLYVKGNYVYLPNSSVFRIVDVSNPANPCMAAEYDVPASEGVYAVGNYVYLAGADNGKLLVLYLEENTGLPQIHLSPGQLQFAGNTSGAVTGAQTIYVNNSGGGTLNWELSDSDDWLICPAVSGTNLGVVEVSVNTRGLAPGTYTGSVFYSSPNAGNSPQAVEVYLTVHQSGQTSPPFGTFETPTHGATVYSSVPFTGWVLDDLGVQAVQLFREESDSLVYIGDAVLVEGARPDVEQAYLDYPNNHKAGWGYMMLTNFLPNQGNGLFTIHAIADDVEGNRVTLGIKTIIVDNNNAVKPFGAIDTPAQGGAASGSNYVNYGWVLTPLPNTVPKDGSTIRVWVDGVNLGHPVYNNYRSDIDAFFPDCNNSDGAGGYFYLDTTQYANGVHTIQWTAVDDGGNTDGIGSRYFTIQNSDSRQQAQHSPNLANSRNNCVPVTVLKGFDENSRPQTIHPGDNYVITVDIKELERIELGLAMKNVTAAYQVVGQRYRALPWGSCLDRERGVFYWQPGHGFLGKFRMVFVATDDLGNLTRRDVEVIIRPKY